MMKEQNMDGQIAQSLVPANHQQLMPPPTQQPAWLKRKTILEEDDYTEEMGKIIEQDFYPDLPIHRTMLQHIDGATKEECLSNASLYEGRLARSLDEFTAKYTSEDNASFAALHEKDLEERRRKLHWLYEPTGEHAGQQPGMLMLYYMNGQVLTGTERLKMDKLLEGPSAIGDDRKNKRDSWKFRVRNQLMFPVDLQVSQDVCGISSSLDDNKPRITQGGAAGELTSILPKNLQANYSSSSSSNSITYGPSKYCLNYDRKTEMTNTDEHHAGESRIVSSAANTRDLCPDDVSSVSSMTHYVQRQHQRNINHRNVRLPENTLCPPLHSEGNRLYEHPHDPSEISSLTSFADSRRDSDDDFDSDDSSSDEEVVSVAESAELTESRLAIAATMGLAGKHSKKVNKRPKCTKLAVTYEPVSLTPSPISMSTTGNSNADICVLMTWGEIIGDVVVLADSSLSSSGSSTKSSGKVGSNARMGAAVHKGSAVQYEMAPVSNRDALAYELGSRDSTGGQKRGRSAALNGGTSVFTQVKAHRTSHRKHSSGSSSGSKRGASSKSNGVQSQHQTLLSAVLASPMRTPSTPFGGSFQK